MKQTTRAEALVEAKDTLDGGPLATWAPWLAAYEAKDATDTEKTEALRALWDCFNLLNDYEAFYGALCGWYESVEALAEHAPLDVAFEHAAGFVYDANETLNTDD